MDKNIHLDWSIWQEDKASTDTRIHSYEWSVWKMYQPPETFPTTILSSPQVFVAHAIHGMG